MDEPVTALFEECSPTQEVIYTDEPPIAYICYSTT